MIFSAERTSQNLPGQGPGKWVSRASTWAGRAAAIPRWPSVAQPLGPALMGPPFPLASAGALAASALLKGVQRRVGPIPVGSSGSVSPEQHFLLQSLA